MAETASPAFSFFYGGSVTLENNKIGINGNVDVPNPQPSSGSIMAMMMAIASATLGGCPNN